MENDRRRASFTLAGEKEGANLKVDCRGPLPDNLAEGIAVLVEGRIDDGGVLHGEKVLTRCDGKYELAKGESVKGTVPFSLTRKSGQSPAGKAQGEGKP